MCDRLHIQGDRSLLYEQFGENSRQILLRSNPHSTGDGLRLGRAAGADIAGDLSSFYGHVIAWPLIEFGPKDFLRLSLSSFSLVGLLVNLSCERFTDESFAHQANAVATAKQPHARAALLVDDAGCSRALENSGATTLDDSAAGEARRAGARVATSLTMEGIARSLTEWGFDVSRLPSTIETYNAMIRRGSTDGEPGRRWNRYPFGAGPYVAFEVRPGITATQGGLRVDASSRVLDRRGQPIPGLFAVGADAGGFYNGGWAGGLSVACVFAMVAVETALQTAPPDRSPTTSVGTFSDKVQKT